MEWKNLFSNIVDLYAQKSKCSKIKVGAIVVRHNRIISTGYNGSPSDKEHCNDYFNNLYEYYYSNKMTYEEFFNSETFLELHSDFSNKNELHAEANAIMFAHQDLNDCEIYISYSPCLYCAKLIVASKIKKVYYNNIYKEGEGIELLKQNNIICEYINNKEDKE